MIPLVGTFFTHESQIKFFSSSLFVANPVGEQLVKQRLPASRAIYILPQSRPFYCSVRVCPTKSTPVLLLFLENTSSRMGHRNMY